MITLDEAIKHAEEKAKELKDKAESNIIETTEEGWIRVYDGKEYTDCLERAKEHEQLASWLKDYKRLLEERPQGEWEEKGKYQFECNQCHYDDIAIKSNFCPNCGANMKGDVEE